MKIEIV